MAEHVSLISLAAWLLHQSEQARASSDFAGEEYGARASLETAARLAQAAQVVKDAADRGLKQKNEEPRSFMANRARRQSRGTASAGKGM